MKIKILLVCLSITAFAAAARAQIAKPVVEDVQSLEKSIKGAPFSAEAVTESIQILADGTRITRRTWSKFYRDGEGRFRREDSRMQLGVPGENIEIAGSIRIMDPVSGLKYTLHTEERTYKQSPFKPKFDYKKETKYEEHVIKQAENEAKQKENAVKEAERAAKQAEKTDRGKGRAGADEKPKPNTVKPLPNDKPANKPGISSKTEPLGGQTIEGVEAEGSRITTVIPVGAIGNDRDIVVVYEKWYSKDLQLTVLSKHQDPRFGEQTFRLSNIRRDNPPIALFSPPEGYKDDDENDSDRVKKPRVPKISPIPKIAPIPKIPLIPRTITKPPAGPAPPKPGKPAR